MDFARGVVLGNTVRLERQLGAGAMGEVWQATHLRLHTQVAVKVMRGPSASEARARFEQEARAVAQMASPFTARVLDCGLTDAGAPFVVMELLHGQDLKARLAQSGKLSLQETIRVVDQTCRALSRAHEMGIVHRDVKPANVFLVESQGTLEVRLLDFGVAKLMHAEPMHMTSTGALIGTPYFMSPEQLFHPGTVDCRADLWAVAVMAYTCLTGRLPFQGQTIAELSVAMHRGSFQPVRDSRPDLPPAVDAWMQRALAPDISRRFGSASELADAFLRASAGATNVPVTAAAPRKSANWLLFALLGLSGLALASVGGFVLLGTSASEARAGDETSEDDADERPRAEPRPKPSAGVEPPAATAQTSSPKPPQTSAPTASAESTSPAPASKPSSAPVARPQAPKWRKRGMRCAFSDKSKSCYPCCTGGDRLEPYPSCECMFDGEKWDREHGKAR